MDNLIDGTGAILNKNGEEQPIKAGDFAPVNPEGLTQVIPMKSTSTAIRATFPSR